MKLWISLNPKWRQRGSGRYITEGLCKGRDVGKQAPYRLGSQEFNLNVSVPPIKGNKGAHVQVKGNGGIANATQHHPYAHGQGFRRKGKNSK